ncbi:acyl-CoA thioesterase I [Mariprofundus micogutta]|uniref:Acyl-CoA thioesterase I n=1 Tax=Mariprofundus micogutta TaxID=1921010 RepID=A0A1L8CK53_9PROT|nr:arylesterase [Mariprofundus micogutta]GAV19287.1 acyl-CoA thioesterase I [Mariprofundus micogutta]
MLVLAVAQHGTGIYGRLPILAVLLFALTACASPPQLPKLAPDAVILAFGDSLTYGSGVQAQQAYPAVLAQLTGREVVNAGLPGEVTEAGLARLPDLLDEVKPAMLILCHGGNDMLRKSSLKAAKANIRAMLVLARARGVSVVLLAVPEPGIFMSPASLYQELASELNIPLDEEILPEILANPGLKSDRIHPNAQGYRMMAEAVLKQLQLAGAL